MVITTNTVPTNKSTTVPASKIVAKLTPADFDKMEKERKAKEEAELNRLLDSGQFDDILDQMEKEQKKNDPERLKKLRIEKDNIVKRYTVEKIDAIKELRESYAKVAEDSEKYNKLKKSGDIMEIKDEKDLENVFSKMMDKHNKSSKFESNLDDVHARMVKIDNIEGKLVDIIPRVSKIDAIEKGMTDMSGKVSRIDSIEKGLLDMGPKISKIDQICEDGVCFKTELADIKKDLAETKKGRIKAEICPTCGEPAVMHSETFLASHCANCGNETEGWNNDDGTPISGWKHYKLRGK